MLLILDAFVVQLFSVFVKRNMAASILFRVFLRTPQLATETGHKHALPGSTAQSGPQRGHRDVTSRLKLVIDNVEKPQGGHRDVTREHAWVTQKRS